MFEEIEVLERAEFKKLKEICEKRQISPEELVEEKVAPLQERISKQNGELISAITRSYEDTRHNGIFHYTPKEDLHVGIITKETRFPRSENHEILKGFLLNIKNPHFISLKNYWSKEFSKYKDNNFIDWNILYHLLVYFMEEPPALPISYTDYGCFSSRDYIPEIKKPRLEIFIGDEQTIPVLENNLEGHQYVKLSKTLGYNLPVSEKIEKRIEKEQLDIFDEITECEKKVRELAKTRDKRVAYAKETDGVIDHGFYIELTDEFVEKMRFNPKISDNRQRIESLLKTAIERGYHESGKKITKRLDAGVNLQIDLKDFFAQRKEKYEL